MTMLPDLLSRVRQALRSRAVHNRRAREGVAATELALCIPFLLLIALACADFGRIASYHQVVCNAARTGAERGATHKFTANTEASWRNEVHEAVLAEMESIPGFNADALDYTLSTTMDSDDLARITVSVSYPFRTTVAWPMLPSDITLRKSVEFRQFR